MNISLALIKTRKELDAARLKSTEDERAARIARQTARAAKIKLKQARKLAKLAKKSARKADDQAEASLEEIDRLQAKVEKLEKRARKQAQKNSKKSQHKASTRPTSSARKSATSRRAKLTVVRAKESKRTIARRSSAPTIPPSQSRSKVEDSPQKQQNQEKQPVIAVSPIPPAPLKSNPVGSIEGAPDNAPSV